MLVLTRKAGEKIVIGDEITVHIKRISSNRVSLAVQAPRDMPIVRSELLFHEEDEAEKPQSPPHERTTAAPPRAFRSESAVA